MKIRDEAETGWPSNLELRRRVAAYARVDRARRFKIGITSKPRERAAVYRQEEPWYTEMVLVYKTFSDAVARELERELTMWFEEDSDNKRYGGAGPHGRAPYFLYVVLKWNPDTARAGKRGNRG